ncbi:2-isopropylmalate synthase [Marinobacter salinexigens]|uniref:2-isopropylmalate synthase n=1 Tax=Marinobacter salinexigens TaxID=2919747 RepID=A0A5B0VFY8_9GAMM|nr:2-isopropylmalate synthase [Marinobacter salinexigens]KAA1173103.1 2-isopropylmalate synthase [Marinobacter salinexigens]
MIQTEAERQFYLGMAGVHLWYARDALPGAAPSPEFVFPEEGEAQPQEVISSARAPREGPAAQAGVQGAGRIPDLQALMGKASEKPAPDRSRAVSTEPETPSVVQAVETDPVEEKAAPAESPIRLNLKLWASDGVCLLCGLTEDSSARLQETLALNILKSIDQASPESVGPIRWPLFNNLKVAGNSSGDLRRVLSSVLSRYAGRTVISLLAADPDGDSVRLLDVLKESGVRADLAFGHSLAELAANPDLKRQLWQQLRSLELG